MSSRLVWKPGKLSAGEWEAMKEHPQRSVDFIMRFVRNLHTEVLLPYTEIILCHHEKPDGTGYPRGLKNNEIPLMSKIISVSDMFDSLTDYRSYRVENPVFTKQEAVQIIEKQWRKGFGDEVFNRIRDILLSD